MISVAALSQGKAFNLHFRIFSSSRRYYLLHTATTCLHVFEIRDSAAESSAFPLGPNQLTIRRRSICRHFLFPRLPVHRALPVIIAVN